MRIFFLVIVFFSTCYSYAQITLWQELREKKNKEEKLKQEEDSTKSTLDLDSIASTLEPDSDLIVPGIMMDSISNSLLDSINSPRDVNATNAAVYQENVLTIDSIYMQRLSRLPNIIGLPYNDTVRRCIELYVERRRDLVENMLGVVSFYFPMIEEILNKYGLPPELKYLTVVESAINPVALSRAGALGLWQFMFSTGKRYGLQINNFFDERRDPVKSTDAACRYLKYLYEMFNDWNLAIAAYNCGEGNVNKAIRRAGGQTDYWAIYRYLPKETRTYLPLFIAANYVMNYYTEHQLSPAENSLPSSTDTVTVNQLIHFEQIADILHIDKDVLRTLNPQYKQDIIPGNYQPQTLTLPVEQLPEFAEKENEIASYRADELFPNGINIVNITGRHERIVHKVARGETVLSIASRYGVSAKNIRKWNGLGSNQVPVGKKLILRVDNAGYKIGKPRTGSTSKQKHPQLLSTKSSANNSKLSGTLAYYRVRSGESFYSIAQKFPGYSHTDLMKLNNVTHPALKIGQYILVPKI